MAINRIAVKRTDMECIHAALEELAEWLQYEKAQGGNVPQHLAEDAQYFAALCAGIINHAPRVTRGA